MSQSPTPEMARYQRLIFSKDGPAPNCRLVLIVLIRFWLAGSDNRIFPSEETLAEDTGLSVRTIRRLIPLLEANGWIKRKPFGVKGQAWRRNEYFLHWPDGFDPRRDKWLQEVKQRKAEGRAAYREAEGWPDPEPPEPPPPPPPPPPADVDMRNIDPEAWTAWISWRARYGGVPSIPAQNIMAGMLRRMPAAEQRAIVQWSTELGHARPSLKDWRYRRWQEEHPEAPPPPPEVREGQLLDFQAARERRQPANCPEPEVHEGEWLPAAHVPAQIQPEVDACPEVPPPPPIDPEPPLPGIEPACWRRLVHHWEVTRTPVTRQQAAMIAQKLVRQASQIAWVDQVIARNLPPPPERET